MISVPEPERPTLAERQVLTEPPAAVRKLSTTMWNVYCGLIHAGFTEKQALTLVGQVLQAGIVASQGST